MANERKVTLSVRAKDDFSDTMAALEKAQKKIIERNREIAAKPPGELRKFYQDTQREVEQTQGKIRDLAREFRDLAAAEGDNRAALGALLIQKQKLQVKAGELRASLDGVREAHQRVKTTQQGGFQAFNATATAMEREARAARELAAARNSANVRLRGMIEARLQAPVRSNFGTFAARETALAAEMESAAQERAAAIAERKAAIQARLNQQANSGFAAWSRYADTISRLAAQEQRAAAIAERKAAIQARLNQQANSGFRAFSRAADGLNLEAAAARNATTQLNRLATAQQRATGTAAAPGGRRARGDSGGRKGEDQDVELYGLRPYQMVNLGYQVNDVISGLAMGQAPLQILAQQAGQFAQIWPNVMVGLVRSLPVLAGTAAALSPLIAAIVRVRTEANTLREITADLALLADGARYSAQDLTALVTGLTKMGVAVTDARAAVKAMVREGFSQEQIAQIGKMAAELSKVSGETFPDEVARLSKAFGGNAESVRDLDRELQFLTADQLEQIRALEQQGRSTEALAVAQKALEDRLRDSRGELTPWQQAVRDAGAAWNTFVEIVRDSALFEELKRGIQQDIEALAAIAAAAERGAAKLQKALNPTSADRYDALRARQAELQAGLSNLDADIASGKITLGMGLPTQADLAEDLQRELAKVNAELALMQQQMAANARFMRNSEESAGDVLVVTEEEKKLRADLGVELEKQLDALRQQADLAAETAKEEFVRQQILEAQNKAKELGLALTQEEMAALRERAGMTFDTLNSPTVTGNYGGIVDRIVGVESGGNANAKNPNSSATGLGQFITATWLRMFKQYFPDRAAGMSDALILELRKDANLSRQMIELYARENAKIMQDAGLAVNDAAVYLAHFLGPGGATAVLKAAPNTPTSQILGADQISANRSILEGKTAADVIAWSERKMAMSDAEVAANRTLVDLDQQRARQQEDYLTGYQQRLADQQFELQNMSAAARQAAIAKAIRDEELKAQAVGLTLSQQQRAEIEATAGALFDRQNAETRVNELLEMRTQLAESLQIAQQAGDRGQVQRIVGEITQTEQELQRAIDAAILFYQALGGPAADAAILKLQNMRATLGETVRDLQTQVLPTAEDLNERMSDIGANGFDALAESLANGENAIDSLTEAFRQGVGQMLVDLGRLILKLMLFNAISNGIAGGGAGGFLAGGVARLFGARHGGGLVGDAAPTRMVDPSVFANARRHHSGGLVGNEVPIIALKDEEVLTTDDPRHAFNGGGKQSVNVRNVNLFDPVDLLEAAMATEAGERVMLNFISRNPAKVNAAGSK